MLDHNLYNKKIVQTAKQVEQFVKSEIYSDFTLNVTTDWAKNRRTHRGGIYKQGPGINIAMHLLYRPANTNFYRFYEYRSYDSNKHIGGFYSNNAEHREKAIICHEIAHAVQFFSYKKENIRCKPHGPVFKKYYKILREEFVNGLLPPQQEAKAQYIDFIKDINSLPEYTRLQEFLSS